MTTAPTVLEKDNSFDCYLKLQACVLGFIETLYSGFSFRLVSNHTTSPEGEFVVDFTMINNGKEYENLATGLKLSFKTDLEMNAVFTCAPRNTLPTTVEFSLKDDLGDSIAELISNCSQIAVDAILARMADSPDPVVTPAAENISVQINNHYLKRVRSVEEVGTTVRYAITLEDGSQVALDIDEEMTINVKPGGYMYYHAGNQFRYIEKENVH